MGERKPWTTAEVAKIRAMGRHMDVPSIAEELGRSRRSVDSMAYCLGISMVALRAWTEAEDSTLRRQADKLPVAALARMLKRSPDTVKRRARALGLSLKKSGHFHHSAKHPPKLRQRYLELLGAGTPQQTAARMVGVHPATARRWGRPA